MNWTSIILAALQFALELWKSRNVDPVVAKARAVLQVTKDRDHDLRLMDQALATVDATAISGQLELLRLHLLKLTPTREK